MSDIEIVLREENENEPTESRSWHLLLPADVAVKQLLTALIPKLGLPAQEGDGRQIGYRLYHVKGEYVLSDDETLNNAGVARNDILLLLKEQGNEYVSEAPEPAEREEMPQESLPMLDIPAKLRYTDQHVWIDVNRGVGRVGITEPLAREILIILDVDLPEKGQTVTSGQVVSTLWLLTESVDDFEFSLPSPVSGVIFEVNKNLTDKFLREAKLDLIQEDPYGEGWLFSILLSENSKMELESLMDAETYQRFVLGVKP